jgi:hypothetical protein
MAEDQPDSPLSTTANVLGILTFALGLLSFCAAFFAITHDAHREMQESKYSIKERKAHIQVLQQYFRELDTVADSELEQSSMGKLVHTSLINLARQTRAVEQEINGTRGRWQWWYHRKDVVTAISRIDSQLQHVRSFQLTFLLL